MAITLAAAPDVLTLAVDFKSVSGDGASKRTQLDGAATDTNIINLLTDMDTLSNARMVRAVWGGRLAAGQKGSASSSSQNLISTWMQLNFEKVDPVNAANTVRKSWALPAYLDALVDTDFSPTVDTPGTGSNAARLGRIIDFLEDSLAYLGADGTYYNGGWTYVGGGFGTGNDVLDGE
jgi:hypothetical protein